METWSRVICHSPQCHPGRFLEALLQSQLPSQENLGVPSSFPRSRLALPFLTWGRDLLPIGVMENR